MVRADVATTPVSWTLVPGTKTALIRLEQFSAGAADDLKAALTEVRAAGTDRLILDLRGNPGGYVNEADAVASQFLKSGIVFIERGADGNETKHDVAAGRPGHGPAAGRPRRRRDRELVGDRVGGAPGRRPGRRSSGSRPTAPGRSSASSRCQTGPPCGSARSSG